ncbi:DEKNAAC100352 [Brettanomyces naardenensis]|uniref:Probable metalloprotease ARX1 n=1 Tax=Brettanomyces naardenensis TaxID=13370 RepID=A0A448YEA5_BRENA|nr:DEKNAAC100352 [Brettanomyces naardenensis]
MSLQVSNREADVLLKQKNILSSQVLSKYRFAGQVTQTCVQYLISLINDSYHFGRHAPYTVAELCILGDSFLQASLDQAFKDVNEKGIAQPVTIDVNDLVEGYSPEIDDKTDYTFQAGDIVTLNLGCQIDGYTSRVAHTVVIYPPGIPSETSRELQPAGPLLGTSADAICASHIATESVVALLGCALSPEKLPRSVAPIGSQVSGSLIRQIVDSIAATFHCIIVPGSKVRRIRRFLAGQAEGVVAERDFKGVVWSEADQELQLLEKSGKFSSEEGQQLVAYDRSIGSASNNSSAIPTDDFVVASGEVYTVDIRMASMNGSDGPGLVTLEVLDQYSGKNAVEGELNPKPSVFIRDLAVNYQVKLRSARHLLTAIDRTHPVYPFKISELSDNFPLNLNTDETSVQEQLKAISKDMKPSRLGMTELTNQRLAVAKPIWAARFVPLPIVLNATTSTGIHGFDAENPTLPGLELPLPRLGITALKLKSLLKRAKKVPVARELATVVLNNKDGEVLRVSGGDSACRPSWVHSNYQLQGELAQGIQDLVKLTQDGRFGIKVRQCQPMKAVSE